MLTGPTVILILKVAVCAVTVLLLSSLVALAKGRVQLHGRINLVFFILTLATVLGFEFLIRFVQPDLASYIKSVPELRRRLLIHLSFSLPTTLLMPVMLYTGLRRLRKVHLALACIFGLLWLGTFITGVFFLPHVEPASVEQ